MKPSGSTRPRLSLIAAGTVALVLGAVHVAWSDGPPPCGAQTQHGAAAGGGLQVQVDPETGTYSMPAPGTLVGPATLDDTVAPKDLVVTPGTSPAGGFKATLSGESLLRQGQE